MNEITRTTTLVTAGTGKTGRRVAAPAVGGGADGAGGLALPASRPSTGTTAAPGARPWTGWTPRTSRSPPTSPCRARRRSSGTSPGARPPPGSGGWFCCRAGASRRPGAPRRPWCEAGVPWTVVRASWFSQNFSEGFLRDQVLAGALTLPVDGVPEPFVDVEDVADVAVAALTGDGHAGRVYEVTGPRALTFAEAAGEIARASGRPLQLVTIPVDAFAEGMAAAGEPPEAVALVRYLFTEVLDGRNAAPADGVRQALGRPPRDFAAYARAAAEAGAWAAQAAVTP